MLKAKLQSNHRKSGFTIVEMLIIAPIVILTIGAFVTAIVNMTGEVLATRSANVLAYSIQDALARIEEDVKLSTTFLAENNVTLTSPQGYDNGTGKFSNSSTANGDMLILNTLVTTANPVASTNSLVYYPDQPNACGSTQVTQNTPMTMNVVYFVKDNTLWRRSLMPANYLTAGCPSMVVWQQPSCAPGQTGAMCQTRDIRLIDGIDASDFVIQYFNRADAAASTAIAGEGEDIEERRIALESQTTIGASINITKTAAGREISHAGSIRATKLDINASSIAQVLPPTTPSAPTVTSSFVGPDSAKFTWPQVPGADTYTVNYSIAGGAYVNGSSGTSNTSFTVSATRDQSVCARVYATNGAGTSPYGEACITIPLWNALVMENSWSDYNGSYSTGAYTKTSAGVVVLKGMIKRAGTPVAGETIATLPAGYRPAETMLLQTISGSINSRFDIYPSGAIIFNTGSGGWLSLEGVSFVPSSAPYTWTLFTLLNGWANYAPTTQWGRAGYTKDSEGRVFTRGLVKDGTTTNNTPIGDLAAGFRPSEYYHFPTVSNNAFDLTGVNTSGNVVAKGVALNSYRSIQHRFYASGSGSWTNLTLENNWVAYGGGFTAPQYTKGADGIVTVKGLVRLGVTTAGTTIATLPATHSPKERTLLSAVCANVLCRLDVMPDGRIITSTGVSATWTSLDDITFMAD